MPHVLALDQGTTSSRAIVFRDDGGVAAVAQREFEQIFPRPGWVEHDPHEIWNSQLEVTLGAIKDAGLSAADIAAIGITNQRETAVVWDRATGEPIHNAIVWQDRRTADACERLKRDGHGELIRGKTGLVVDAYFSGTKVAWILDHVDGARARAERGELAFGTVDSWLIWKLTGGGHVTDASNASRTMLFDIHAGAWDGALCDLIGVPMPMLPEVRPSSGEFGTCVVDGLGGIAIAGVAGDQQAATFGQVCTRPGMAKNTYGTGCFLLANTGQRVVASNNKLLSTVAWARDEAVTYALEGSVFIGGAVVQWLRDGLGIINSSSEVESLALSVPDNGGVYLVPALVGLGAPHWDPGARGAVFGLTRGTSAGHFCAGGARGDRVQRGGSGRRDGGRRGNGADRVACRRRRVGERHADAVPGGHAADPADPADGARDDGARRGVPGRSVGRGVGVGRRDRAQLGGGSAVRAGDAGTRGGRVAVAVGRGGRAFERVGMKRDDMIAAVRGRETPWDIVVIGGGATGLGSAIDAASRGFDVALFEGADFANGTSSRSTKLVHGGVRYLQQGNVSLVMEALKERGLLRQNAPHLVSDLAFIVPSYEWWESPFYGIGLKVYDMLAGRYGFGRSKMLSADRVTSAIPSIRTDGLRGGTLYYDGQFDDARLAINMATTAFKQGATVVNHTPVVGLLKDGAGQIEGVRVRDDEGGDEFGVRARVVVNATGPFVDGVRRMDRDDAGPMIAPSQGVHIVLDREFLPGDSAIMVPHTDDGRVMFAIPWHDVAVVGTTDTPVEEISLEPRALDEEIGFILETANRYLSHPAERGDIRSVFAGIRPLVKAGAGDDTAALSREHTILIDPDSGLMTVAGGKWTTYRKMAEDVVDQAILLGDLDARGCVTRDLPIHGHHMNAERFGRLSYYGADAPRIEQLAAGRQGARRASPCRPAADARRGGVVLPARDGAYGRRCAGAAVAVLAVRRDGGDRGRAGGGRDHAPRARAR